MGEPKCTKDNFYISQFSDFVSPVVYLIVSHY